MRSSILVVVLALAFIAWLPTMASAQVGEAIGACGIEFNAGNQSAVECTDGVTQSECADFCSGCGWFEGQTCAEQKFSWQGSCFFDDISPGGSCWLWEVEEGSGTPEFHCEQTFGGVWSDDLVCGGVPVPALPKAAYAVLAFVLLAGTLTLLTLRGRHS